MTAAATPPDLELAQLLDGVEGWMPLPEAGLLCALAASTSGPIVEIGCYRGRSTIALALGASRSGDADRTVYAVDPHARFTGAYGGRFGPEDRAAFYRNVEAAGLGARAALISLPSLHAARAWEQSVGLLFVDGDHRYEAVAADLAAWSPLVATGGTIVLDDAADPAGGPGRVVAELIAGGRFATAPSVGKLRVVLKL